MNKMHPTPHTQKPPKREVTQAKPQPNGLQSMGNILSYKQKKRKKSKKGNISKTGHVRLFKFEPYDWLSTRAFTHSISIHEKAIYYS